MWGKIADNVENKQKLLWVCVDCELQHQLEQQHEPVYKDQAR